MAAADRLNLVWVLVDSIRTYHTEADLRGKLPVMDRFGKGAVGFSRCVTTAPSTIMSVTAMMTGLPAYYVARDYDRFRFEKRSHSALAPELKKLGYTHHAFLRGFETREKFKNLLDMVPREFWPEDLKYGGKWRNEDLNRVLDRVLDAGLGRPAFLFFHFNPKTRSETREVLEDPETSDRVEYALSRIRSAGFTDENTIFVLCSDHGFPDPATGMNSDWEARHRLSHDLVLTDDNVLIPLYIRYPGCTPGRVDTPVSSLDLFPTLLELLDVPGRQAIEASVEGESLAPLMEPGHEDRYTRTLFRVDSRLMFQTGRSTAIRGERFKYIQYRDDCRFATVDGINEDGEVLVDLASDPLETRNLLLEPSLSAEGEEALEAARREFHRTEARALEYQVSQLFRSGASRGLDLDLGKAGKSGSRILLLFDQEGDGLRDVALETFRRAVPGAELHAAAAGIPAMANRSPEVRWWAVGDNGDRRALMDQEKFDLSVLFVSDLARKRNGEASRIARQVGAHRSVVMDGEFRVAGDRYWYYRFRSFFDALPRVVEEPSLVVSQLRRAGLVLSRRILSRLGRWEGWGDARDDAQEKGR